MYSVAAACLPKVVGLTIKLHGKKMHSWILSYFIQLIFARHLTYIVYSYDTSSVLELAT